MLSIVIPTYNEETCLPLLLASIKSQSYTDYEVIVSDHNSTDRTRQIAAEYGAIVVDGGRPGKSRNRGAAVARGNTILFLDADVVLNKDSLLDIVAEFAASGYGAAACRLAPMSSRRLDKLMHSTYNTCMRMMSRVRPIAPGSCIIVRSYVHLIMNGFDEDIMLGEDCDYVWRANKITKFGILRSYINVSVRRFDRDGRLNIAVKYILSGLYMLVFGKIKTDLFRYTFGHKQ